MERYRLLFLDIDGTLVKHYHDRVSEPVVRAITKAQDRQVKVSLCTGRSYQDVREIIHDCKLQDQYHILESGAKIMNPNGQVELSHLLERGDVLKILEIAKGIMPSYSLCVEGQWVDGIENYQSGEISTVSLHAHSSLQTQAIMGQIHPLFDQYHIAIGSHWELDQGAVILITHKLASKRFGAKYIQQKLGILKTQTMSIGDMPNDLPLFEVSGLNVAMGNGDLGLKSAADYTAPTVNNDGVAWAIERFILDNKIRHS